MRRDSQRGRVLHMLQVNPEGVCGTSFLIDKIPRYSARISELRRQFTITKIPCPYPFHSHVTHQWAWKLDVDGQGSMF